MKYPFVTILTSFFILIAGTATADETVARALLQSQGCKGCHVFEGDGGTLGPALDNIGARMSTSQIQQKLLDPKKSNPKSYMPGFSHLKDAEMKALVNFLKSRK